jgi:hypothetical protein
MAITYHDNFEQGSEQWLNARCGLLTASEMKLIVTPTLKAASNDNECTHLYELLAQRISNYVEPRYVSDDMLRGQEDEIEARILYEKHCEPVTECGFITNDRWGFTIGYSPDGLVGDDGLIEVKSRRQKYQVQTLVEHVLTDTIPADYLIQCQTGLMVSEREWLDFISYCGGLTMPVIRVYPDAEVQSAIAEAAEAFEARLAMRLAQYRGALESADARLILTERKIHEEMIL